MTKQILRSLILIFLGFHATSFAADHWKLINRGADTYVVRLRPASNRKAGFIPEKVEPGETKSIPLAYQGSFDLNIQFLDKDGKVKVSWTSDQPIDLRNRTYPEAGDDMTDVAMLDPTAKGLDGKLIPVVKRMPILKGVRFEEAVTKLYRLGAVNTDDPKNPKMDFAGSFTVGEKAINFRLGGTTRAPSFAFDGETYEVSDLVICRNEQEGRVVLTGTYSSNDRVGEFVLERRDSFPFQRFSLEWKPHGDTEWTSFQLHPSAVAEKITGGDSLRLDDVRSIVFEFQQPLQEGQIRVEKRLTEIEEKLNGRLAEVELRLMDPKLLGVMRGCVECHRARPIIAAPMNVASLLMNIPKMSAANRDEMIQRSKLNEQDKQQFINYANELAITLGR